MSDPIAEIEWIRAKNNTLWMKLMRIALKSNPTEAKEVLRQINENDQAISKLLGSLADDC